MTGGPAKESVLFHLKGSGLVWVATKKGDIDDTIL